VAVNTATPREILISVLKRGSKPLLVELERGGTTLDVLEPEEDALALGIQCGTIDIVVFLVDHMDAQVTLKALQEALYLDRTNIISFLLDHWRGAIDIDDLVDDLFRDLLCTDMDIRYIPMMALLLDRGAKLDAVESDEQGFSAMMHAVYQRCYEVAAFLLAKGARADLVTTYNANIWELLDNSFADLTITEEAGVVAIMRNLLVSNVPLTEDEEAYLFLDQDLPPAIRLMMINGLRLRRRMGYYIRYRRRFLGRYFFNLVPGVMNLIKDFEGPFTTEETWATGLAD
jgi:hypothetical protein